MLRPLLTLVLLASLWLSSTPAVAEGWVPTSDYRKEKASGFTLYVAPSLSTRNQETRRGLTLLRSKLAEATKVLPKDAVVELRQVAIFVESHSESDSCVGYHPAAEPTEPNDFNPDKAQAIEIGTLSCFLRKANGDEPSLLIRELALAYLDRSLSWDAPEINAIWKQAKKSGRYELIPYTSGGMLQAAALASPQFFFAETSESLFGDNDFFPFHREDLVRYDPDACAVVAKAWGNERLCEPSKKLKPEKEYTPRKRGRYRRKL